MGETIVSRSFRAPLAALATAATLTASMPSHLAFAQEAGDAATGPLDEAVMRAPIALGMRFQESATDIMREIAWFEGYTLVFLIPIGILVGALLGYVLWRFSETRNPVASRTAHNTTIEVVWTVAPVLILLFLAIPSFQLLSAQFDPPGEAEVTIKATGYQWYWGYEYQNDEDGTALVSFDSIPLLEDKDRDTYAKTDEGLYPKLLVVDNELVVPVDTVVRLLVTGGDVIHSWTVPSFGKKMDAIPGRLNETWFKVNEVGMYYGQCSELCGKDHAFMPIAVRVVPREDYALWLEAAASGRVEDANKLLLAGFPGARDIEAVDTAMTNAAAPGATDATTVPVAN